MFDLNELPENDGAMAKASAPPSSSVSAGGSKHAIARGAHISRSQLQLDEEKDIGKGVDEVGRQEYTVHLDEKVANRGRDVAVESHNQAKVGHSIPLRMDSAPFVSSPKAKVEASVDEGDADDIAGVEDGRRLRADSQYGSGLNSAVVASSADPGASFGISPLPEKLGQRPELPRRQLMPVSNSPRLSGKWPGGSKWPGVLTSKKPGGRVESELKLDRRHSPTGSGPFSTKIGKRPRDDRSDSVVDMSIGVKRRGSPATLQKSDDEAGPSLTMALDQSKVITKDASFPSSQRLSLEREAATTLTLGESLAISLPSRPDPSPIKSEFGLSVNATPTGKRFGSSANDLAAVGNIEEDEGTDDSMAIRKMNWQGRKSFDKSGSFEKPFWQGRFSVEGSWADVAAYCSQYLHPASKLWSLPRVIAVERVVKMEEFLEVSRRSKMFEPPMRFQLQPGEYSRAQSFFSLVTALSQRNKVGSRDVTPEIHGGTDAWRKRPMKSEGASDVLQATLRLKQTKHIPSKNPAKLYLVTISSCEFYPDIRKHLMRELSRPASRGDNVLFGFLCAGDDENFRFARGSRAEHEDVSQGMSYASGLKDDEQAFLPRRLSNGVDGVTGNFRSNSISEKRSQDPFHGDKGRGWRDHFNYRRNLSPLDGDVYQDLGRHRERDRDLRSMEKERDLRSFSKSFPRYHDRSRDPSDMSRRGMWRDTEFDWSRDKSLRDPQWGQEKEKQKDRAFRHRERDETEDSIRKRFRSSESDKEIEVESFKSRLKPDDLSTGKDTQRDKLEEERKKKLFHSMSLEGTPSRLTYARGFNTIHPQTEGTDLASSAVEMGPGRGRHQGKEHASGHVESTLEVRETASSKPLREVKFEYLFPELTGPEVAKEGDAKFNTKAAGRLHDELTNRSRVAGVGSNQKASAGVSRSKDSQELGSAENTRDSVFVSGPGGFGKRNAAGRVLGNPRSRGVNELLDDQSFDQVRTLEDESNDAKEKEFEGGECTLESLSNEGEKDDSEMNNAATGHTRGVKTERSVSPDSMKLRAPSSAQGADVVRERSRLRDSEQIPRNGVDGTYVTQTYETVVSGADEFTGKPSEAESPSIDNALDSSSSLSVVRQIVLEACDKETRMWLVSSQYRLYLAEEFGVGIQLEDVGPNSDSGMNDNRGSLDVRASLTAVKSADTAEANWFMDHAADTILALSSRGVFSKYLWYQGRVQRHASDHAPTIRVIVRKIRGQDGRNLERIQDETGVMIGIVHTKKEIVDPTRVIGLRLNGTRKKSLDEASTLVQRLLSEVAEKFPKVLPPSQDLARLQPKSEFPNCTPPSPLSVTPLGKDAIAPYSPAAAVLSTDTLKRKYEESSEALYSATAHGEDTLVTLEELAPPSRLDEQGENDDLMIDAEGKALRNSVLIRNVPKDASGPTLREGFEDVLKSFSLCSDDESSEMVVDVTVGSDKSYALLDLASYELLLEVMKLYSNNKQAFGGLILELGPTGNRSSNLERSFPTLQRESVSKLFDYDRGAVSSPNVLRSKSGRRGQDGDDRQPRVSAICSNADSEHDTQSQGRGTGSQTPGATRYPRPGARPPSLFVTELMRNANEISIEELFEEIIRKHCHDSVKNFDGLGGYVKAVRFMPQTGCAFVDLATHELVDVILELHSERPDLFHHMKVERKPVPSSQGEAEEMTHGKRPFYVNMSNSFKASWKGREHFQSSSPPLATDHEHSNNHNNNYEEDEQEEKQQATRKHRSDPERTVYADRLPEGVTEELITRIFEQVLGEHMTDEQREVCGEDTIEQVRHVPAKYCAFIVFKTQQLTRLVLQLYNQDEEIFKNMRLKPHFHSKMEDLYKSDDVHEREDGTTHRLLTRDLSSDRRKRRMGMDDHSGYLTGHGETLGGPDLGVRGRLSFVHRAVASTAYKEVDRRRSVYVDRIPEWLMPEPTMRETFERALKQNTGGYGPRLVSEVTFFRDKFDHERLCAFVELENEDLVQELLETYNDNEAAFSGMRVRPAVKYG